VSVCNVSDPGTCRHVSLAATISKLL